MNDPNKNSNIKKYFLFLLFIEETISLQNGQKYPVTLISHLKKYFRLAKAMKY